MATQHPEQERLSMRARPELGQMRTKHMSPWQPSKNKIERVREAGGTRISSNWIEHAYVRMICVCAICGVISGQMEQEQIVLFMLLCFSGKFWWFTPLCVTCMTLASHSNTICSSSTEVPVHEIGKNGEVSLHAETPSSFQLSDSHVIVQ